MDLTILRVVGGHEMDQWGVLVVGGLRERESSERWGECSALVVKCESWKDYL